MIRRAGTAMESVDTTLSVPEAETGPTSSVTIAARMSVLLAAAVGPSWKSGGGEMARRAGPGQVSGGLPAGRTGSCGQVSGGLPGRPPTGAGHCTGGSAVRTASHAVVAAGAVSSEGKVDANCCTCPMARDFKNSRPRRARRRARRRAPGTPGRRETRSHTLWTSVVSQTGRRESRRARTAAKTRRS